MKAVTCGEDFSPWHEGLESAITIPPASQSIEVHEIVIVAQLLGTPCSRQDPDILLII